MRKGTEEKRGGRERSPTCYFYNLSTDHWYRWLLCLSICLSTSSNSSSRWPQSRIKNSLNFPGFSRAIKLLFHRLRQQKANVIITFIMIVMIMFTQSTAVLHKYSNDKLKLRCLLKFSPWLHRIP